MTDQGITVTFVLGLAAAAAAGGALGGLYLLGLWYTVRRHVAGASGFWLATSLLVRLALLLAGFYLVMAGSWQRLVACLVGFVLARAVVTRLAGPARARSRLSSGSAT